MLTPTPWFLATNPRIGATLARATRNCIYVLCSRYVAIPVVGMSGAPLPVAAGSNGSLRGLVTEGFAFHIADAHSFISMALPSVMLG